MTRALTFGTFDVFHVGHVNVLARAKDLADELYVGVSSDELNFSKKNRYPVYSQEQRMQIISVIKYVDHVFVEESLELKREYLLEYDADILVMGDDWKGKFDIYNDVCDVIYLSRTPSISTTELIEVVKSL